jgi:hypothetical protein
VRAGQDTSANRPSRSGPLSSLTDRRSAPFPLVVKRVGSVRTPLAACLAAGCHPQVRKRGHGPHGRRNLQVTAIACGLALPTLPDQPARAPPPSESRKRPLKTRK